jgi:hypothetical protein
MATALLFGASGDSYDNLSSLNYFTLNKWTCPYTGTITQIKTHCGASGYVKLAIYADNNGEPGALIQNFGEFSVASGWNTHNVTNVSVTKDTVYWLARNSSTSSIYYLSGPSANFRYKSAAYSGFSFPDPAGSGFSSDSSYNKIAAWGILVVSPSSTTQPISYGTPELKQGLVILPSSIVQPIAIGIPSLRYPQTISPQSLVVTILYGTPSVGVFGIIKPASTVQPISIGSPTILKYVWHVILDGQYATETPGINRAYVIGRDQYGNPVYGTAVDSTELGLVGERLDFQQELAIPTEARAGDVASAILAKMRLMGKRGVILIPPNCGQELFDVVEVTDSQGNQSAVKYRVVGIRFDYRPRQVRYHHQLILGAP